MDNSFVYETFEIGEDGSLMLVINKSDIQVVAKREKTVIIPNDIQLTYPLQFKVEDLVSDPEVEEAIVKIKKTKKSKNKETTTPKPYTTKSPNKFFIYRKAWVEEFKVKGYQYSMTDISGFIAERWRREPDATKAVFIDMAEKAKMLHRERYGGVRKIRNKPRKEKKSKINNKVNKNYNNKINTNSHQDYYYRSGNNSPITNNNCDAYTFPYYTSDITAQYQQPFLNYNMSYNDTSTSSIASSPLLSYGDVSPGRSSENETTSYLELCPSGHDGSLMLLVE
nr:1671_t:CDS:2 [Entrophospora candida]